MEDKLLTVTQVAERLAVCGDTVRRWLKEGSLRGYRIAGYRWRIPENAIDEFLKRNAGGGNNDDNGDTRTP